MASLDNPKYAYRIAGSADADWTLVEVTDGSFPESFPAEGETEYEVKTKVWSPSAFITTGPSSYVPVAQPIGSNVVVPFSIERNGSSYRHVLSFNLRDYANITVAKEYYIDSVDGNDANDGLTISTPLKTLTAANSKGDGDRFNLKRGSVFQKNQRPTDLIGSKEIVAYGTGNKPRITSLVSNQVGVLTKTSNYWSGPIGDYAASVYDKNFIDPSGLYSNLISASSIAEVDTTPGSFWWNANTIYIRLADDREPDALVDYYDALALRVNQPNITQYFENIEFNGGLQARADALGGLKALFYKCEFIRNSNILAWGCKPSILQECVFNIKGGDCVNIDNSNGVQGNHIEIDISATNNNSGDSTSQASTAHNTSLVCRIGGQYFNTAGQCIADVNSANSWNMGMQLSGSTGGIGFYNEGDVWVERSNFGLNAEGIQIAGVGSTFYHKDNTGTVVVTGDGSYTPY